MKRWIIISILFLLSCTNVTTGYEPTKLEHISSDSFRPVIVSSSPDIAIIPDFPAPSASAKPTPKVVKNVAKVEPKVVKEPKPKGPRPVTFDGGIIKGRATYMCNGNGNNNCHYKYPDTPDADFYAAAGPAIRKMLGPGWRNEYIKVMKGNHSVTIKLVDWCECHKGTADERILDLYADAFEELAPLWKGKIWVRAQER